MSNLCCVNTRAAEDIARITSHNDYSAEVPVATKADTLSTYQKAKSNRKKITGCFCHLPPTKHNEDIGSAISIEKRKVNTVQDSFGFYKNKRQVSGVIMSSWAYCQAGV